MGVFGYLGVFALVFALNVVPVFMPPTWLLLSTLYFLFPQHFHPALLAFFGTGASTCGRVVLSYLGSASRRMMKEERKRSLDRAGWVLKGRKYGGFFLSFVYALGPLPSNAYFLTVGMMRGQYFGVFLGFWLGRFISYWVMIHVSQVAFFSLMEVLTSQLYSVIVVDSLGIVSMVFFAFIDWDRLFRDRRIVFIRPRFLRRSGEESEQR